VTAQCCEVFESLSAREFDVLRLLATGATNAQMARTLNLSEGTIRNAIARLTRKLGVADRTQAALLASRAGLGS
jgi:DNA-binding NarL/FixJ family response regulator